MYGQLGNGTTDVSPLPVKVVGGLSFVSLYAGGYLTEGFTCGLIADGTAYCWGQGFWGQLGNGGDSIATAPVPVAGGHTFVSLGTGVRHACGITTAEAALCWGTNDYGELGSPSGGFGDRIYSPFPVAGETVFTIIDGGTDHSCGLTSAGALYCWGNNFFGQLARTGNRSSEPIRGAVDFNFSSITAGFNFNCGMTKEQIAVCWGESRDGQLGAGISDNRSEPVRVLGQP